MQTLGRPHRRLKVADAGIENLLGLPEGKLFTVSNPGNGLCIAYALHQFTYPNLWLDSAPEDCVIID